MTHFSFRSSTGFVSRGLALAFAAVLALAAPTTASDDPPEPPSLSEAPAAELVARAFERFRALEGEWRARSTEGWTGTSTFRPLARGSVVLAISGFDDAPPERDMASAIHRDGDRLLLTHYCEAGNQPRLVATRIEPDAAEVELTFLDGTDMESRDDPHMDRAIFRFLGEDRFSSRWTFFRDGEERWLEEIEYVRVPGGSESSPPPSGAGR